MKVVILAGGRGTRMGSLTSEIPKPMVKLAGKPILEYLLNGIKDYNLNDVSILVGYKSKLIRNYFGNGDKWGLNINYYQDPQPLGTAGSIKNIEHKINNDFMVLYGDTVLDVNLKDLIKYHESKITLATLVVHPNDHPYDSDLVKIDKNNIITGFYSKPHRLNTYRQNLVNAALYILSPKVLKYIKKNEYLDFGKDIFPSIINEGGNKIYAYNTTEYIKDIGTIDRLKEVERDYLSGKIKQLNKTQKQNAIYLDRDGVINYDNIPVVNITKFKLMDRVTDAIKLINKSTYLSIIITNQPLVAKGKLTIDALSEIHNYMEYLLGEKGAYINKIYYCPHHPDKGYEGEIKEYKIQCNCRKPKTGLINRSVEEMNVNLAHSFFIGDRTVDMMTGLNAKINTILIRQGCAGNDGKYNCTPDYIFNDLYGAVNFIVNGYNLLSIYLQSKILNFTKPNKDVNLVVVGGLPSSGKSTLAKTIEKYLIRNNVKVYTLHLDRCKKIYKRDGKELLTKAEDSSIVNINCINVISNVFDSTNNKRSYNSSVMIIEGNDVLLNDYIKIKNCMRFYTFVSEEKRRKRLELTNQNGFNICEQTLNNNKIIDSKQQANYIKEMSY